MELTTKPARNPSTPLDRTLNELQKKIYGKRTTDLTPAEVHQLFRAPINPEFNLILYRALERKVLDPDVAILQAIPRAVTNDYLTSIAFCLRFGANPNMYVNVPKLGTVHLMGYTYYVLGGDRFSATADVNVLNTIVLMLIVKGSRPSMPMFDKNAGKIRSEIFTSSQSLSVVEWLNDQGYPHILDKVAVTDPLELRKVVDPDSLTQLAIYLDMPALSPRTFEPRDMLNAIRTHSHSAFDRIPVLNVVVMMDHKTLDESVIDLNATAYSKLLAKGQSPSYLLIDRILVDMKYFKDQGGIIALKELEYMLIQSVNGGTQLDLDQRTILTTLGTDILDATLKAYNSPYWLKVCKNPNSSGKTPGELKNLAASLNIDPTMSKAAICENISELAKVDRDALKEAAKRRQQMRMIADMGTMNEFLNGQTPNLTCRNRSSFTHDPLEYNDVDIAYYRDDQGAVWCFPSDLFASLIETGVNPYNQTMLPASFVAQLKYQLEVLKLLGVEASQGEVGVYVSKVPSTFSSSIDSLTSPDQITEKSSARAVQQFVTRGSQNGMAPQSIRAATKDQMMAALRTINYQVDLSPLSTSHALVTTARIVNHVAASDPTATKTFFEALSSEKLI